MRYSFIVPIYHDAALAADFCTSFEASFRSYLELDDVSTEVELIFVNDDGSAATTDDLIAVCDRFAFAKMIELNRNFGQHIALSCGYRHASGELVGMLNVDQEDPPSEIPKLIDALESSDAEMAICLRTSGTTARGRRMTSRLFNWVLNKATGYSVPVNVGTLRVMKRAAVDRLNDLPERSRFLPGLESWFGFRTTYVDTAQQPRRQGRSSYRPGRRLRMAFEAIISFSDLPLRFVVLLGMVVSAIGFILAAFLVFSQILLTDYQPGYPSTVAAVVFVGGVQIAVIGLASLYIGRILTEVQHRPLYVVRKTYKVGAGSKLQDVNEREGAIS
ncbi:MAG: glycosyltransferase [Solirubrobacterales bacterium]|nr:glycosyltransferase [Solirubrobacterales bacterium]